MDQQFCKDIIEFLQSEYDDGYSFKLEARKEISGFECLELKIKVGPCFTIKVGNTTMQYIFSLYCSGEYIQERKQWRWQKELINTIEGA